MQQDDNFRDYVALADQGRSGLGAIVLGSLLAIGCWIAGTAIVIIGSAYLLSFSEPALDANELFDRTMTGRLGAVVMLLTIASFWPAVWLALRFVHRRAFVSVLGATLRVDRSDMWRGCAAALVVSVATTVPYIVLGDPIDLADLKLGAWLVWLLPMMFFILLQASAEELFFRGYLMQALAYRFRSPIVWAGLPGGVFTLLHWYESANTSMNAAILVSIGAVALATTLLVYLTGNLGAAIGIHWGNNIAAFLFVSSDEDVGSIALATTPPLTDPSWTGSDAFSLAIVGIFSTLATIWLLIHPRSPLRLDTFRQHQASD